ncbi:MAG: 7-cyano-7-deazaguanine synthase QueC [Deltaproteobacteria bacterium]|nr:7-cyano-7-deazaguanine synthase QueC [Deltaproteobacteria bacterium]
MLDPRAALVVFSGGQDSTTCLAWALERYERVATVGFDYRQRHRVELDCRQAVRRAIVGVKPAWRARLGDDVVLDLGLLKAIGGTALTDAVAIHHAQAGLPNTFVPGRNLLFLTAAAACAYRQGIAHLVTGVCETDFSGYPDCRDDTMKALQVTLNLGMDARFVVHTPLMWLDKQATWALGQALGGDAFTRLVVEQTHTCYEGDRATLHPWGYGCGRCPACGLRRAGHEAFVAAPPTGS